VLVIALGQGFSGPSLRRLFLSRLAAGLNFPDGTPFNWVYSDPDYPIEASVKEKVEHPKKNGHEILWRRLSNFG
jgi:hypothetical protein